MLYLLVCNVDLYFRYKLLILVISIDRGKFNFDLFKFNDVLLPVNWLLFKFIYIYISYIYRYPFVLLDIIRYGLVNARKGENLLKILSNLLLKLMIVPLLFAKYVKAHRKQMKLKILKPYFLLQRIDLKSYKLFMPFWLWFFHLRNYKNKQFGKVPETYRLKSA